MTTDNKKKWSFMQGITTHNPVFASGLAIAPAVFAGSTLSGALTYAAYIPFYIYFDGRLPADPAKLGMFLPMIATSQFVVSASELRFFRMSRPQMMADVISHIIGLDIAIIFMGAVRELFSTGGINGALYGITHVNPLIGAPCGGFIMIGLMGALIRLCSKK